MDGDAGFESRQGQESFWFYTTSTPALGPTQSPVPWIPGFFPWGKSAGVWVDHSSLTSAEVKNEWRYNSTPPVFFHGVERNNFTFTSHQHLSPQWFMSLRCCNSNSVTYVRLTSSMCVTGPAYLSFLYSFVVLFGKQVRLWSASLCRFCIFCYSSLQRAGGKTTVTNPFFFPCRYSP